MKQELREYIKRCIILEQQHQSNIIKDIVNKFPSNYILPLAGGPARGAAGGVMAHITSNKRDAFWKRYKTDKAFMKLMGGSYAYEMRDYFDFWLPWDELREYLKPELQSAELLLIEKDRTSALKISDVSSALEIAENYEEFEEMVKTLR